MPPRSYYSGKKSNWKTTGRVARSSGAGQGYNQFSRKSGSTKITPKTVKKNKPSISFTPVLDAIKNVAKNIGPIKILPAKLPDTRPKGTKIITNKMPGTNKYKISTMPSKTGGSRILTEKDFGMGPFARNPYDAFKKEYPKGTKTYSSPKKVGLNVGGAYTGGLLDKGKGKGAYKGKTGTSTKVGLNVGGAYTGGLLNKDKGKGAYKGKIGTTIPSLPVAKPFRPTDSDVKGDDYVTRRNKLSTVALPKSKPKNAPFVKVTKPEQKDFKKIVKPEHTYTKNVSIRPYMAGTSKGDPRISDPPVKKAGVSKGDPRISYPPVKKSASSSGRQGGGRSGQINKKPTTSGSVSWSQVGGRSGQIGNRLDGLQKHTVKTINGYPGSGPKVKRPKKSPGKGFSITSMLGNIGSNISNWHSNQRKKEEAFREKQRREMLMRLPKNRDLIKSAFKSGGSN